MSEPARPLERRAAGPPNAEALLHTRVRWTEKLAGRVLWSYLGAVGRRARYTCTDADGRPLARTFSATIDERLAARGRLIVTYWIADAFGMAALPFADPDVRGLMSRFRCLVDDTFTGRVSGALIVDLGGRVTRLALIGDPLRLQQVQDVMRERGSVVFPVDGGGPYGEVGTGLAGLAVALDADVVPIAIAASRTARPLHRSGLWLPLPGARMVVAVGPTITITRAGDRRRASALVKQALDALRTTVTDRVRGTHTP